MTTEFFHIKAFWLKQFNDNNNLKDFLPSKIRDYSFLVGKIKLKDLLVVWTSTMLKEFYSFNSIDKELINADNINEKITDENLKKSLDNFLKNYSNKISDIEVLEQLKLWEEFENDTDDEFLNIIPQRLTDNTRLSEIWQYLRGNSYPFFPNSFICAVNLRDMNIVNNDNYFSLNLKREKSTIFVIDGQHRLYGSLIKKAEAISRWYVKENEIDDESIVSIEDVEYILANKDMEVIITLMINIPIELQASLFQIINFKTQRIRSSLYFDLFNFPINDISQDELAHSIVLNLYLKDKDAKKSAWYLIHLSEFYPKADPKLYISQWAIAKRIRWYFDLWELFYFYKNEDIKSKLFTKGEIEKEYSKEQIDYYNKIWSTYTNFMYDYFAAIKLEYNDTWWNNDYQVVKSTWVGVFMNLLSIIYAVNFLDDKIILDLNDFMKYSSFGKDANIALIADLLKGIRNTVSFDKETLRWSAWFWIQWRLTTDIIQVLYKKWRLEKLLSKEAELKSLLKNEDLKEISCRERIFRPRANRYLKSLVNKEYVPDEEYFAISLLIIIWFIYHNLEK